MIIWLESLTYLVSWKQVLESSPQSWFLDWNPMESQVSTHFSCYIHVDTHFISFNQTYQTDNKHQQTTKSLRPHLSL